MHGNVQGFFFTHQIELFLWPACSHDRSPIENAGSMLAQRMAQGTSFAATLDQLSQYVEVAWTALPQGYIQSLFDSLPRRVAVVIANNGSATLTTHFVIIHTSQQAVILIV
ncbi:transposable element Tcb1 transposase [Trichonephila clavipes]|uniref:Transposable element Tcb1 transposase n=1 Tax=Trichonephila clavipes TaxID=2585209 RepID=A0A8X6S9K8_TRICX|nr:transposable element Tcb1 transposase [Trichonephila clavipes]